MRNRPAPGLFLTIMLILSACGSPSPSNLASDSAIPANDGTRAGWILLEHVGADAPEPDAGSLWLIRPDGTDLHELAPEVPIDGKTNPVWSLDGTHIAFESVQPRRLVYETDVAGSAPVPTSRSCSGVLVEPNPCYERSPAYSPDGNRLATVVNTLSGHGTILGLEVIYLRARYGQNEVCAQSETCFHLGFSLDATQVATTTASIEGLSWSPGGTQIAYHRVAKDVDDMPLGSELWIVDADGTHPHPITLPDGLSAWDPDWSPDGSLIVFSSQPIHDSPDIYTVRTDGTDLRQLTHDGGSGAPSWTSDGKILFSSMGELWLMDAYGSHAAPVFPDGLPAWGEEIGWSHGYWQPVP